MVSENPLLGFLTIAVAGISNGSFAVPSKRISVWKWENVWLVYCVTAMGLLPIGLAVTFAPRIITQLLGSGFPLAVKVWAFGVCFGFGALLFGVSLARLGMAITNALVSGVIVLLGSVAPVLVGSVQLDRRGWLHLSAGLAILVTSIGLCAAASLNRDRVQQPASDQPVSRKRSIGGILIAILAAVLSSMINVGFALGIPLIKNATLNGNPAFLASLAVWIPVLLGGLVINLGYTTYLTYRRRTWRLFSETKTCENCWGRCFSMGLLWFGAILLYGYGVSLIGSTGMVYGWAASSSASILTSNAWGAAMGEWKNSGTKSKVLMSTSTVLLVASFVVLSAQ